MNFDLTEEEKAMMEVGRDFAQKEIAPTKEEDEKEHVRHEVTDTGVHQHAGRHAEPLAALEHGLSTRRQGRAQRLGARRDDAHRQREEGIEQTRNEGPRGRGPREEAHAPLLLELELLHLVRHFETHSGIPDAKTTRSPNPCEA